MLRIICAACACPLAQTLGISMSIAREISDFLMIFFFLGGALLLVWVMFKQKDGYLKYAIGALDKKLLPIKDHIGEYEFFTTGHPDVWVQTNYKDLCKIIGSSCRGVPGSTVGSYIVGPANVFVKINEEKKAIYVIVSGSESTKCEWPQLMHYQEWVESNKALAERIAEYKEKEARNA